MATCGVRLDNLEREILRVMAASEGNLLEDENAINTLKTSQEERDEVLDAQSALEKEMLALEKQRQPYRALASAVSPTFFLLQDMSRIRSIYQYSLPLFMEWFGQAIRESPHTEKIGQRVRSVLKEWTRVLLDNATASFFERDEMVFLLRVAIVSAAKRAVEEGDGGGGSKKTKGGKKKKTAAAEKKTGASGGGGLGGLSGLGGLAAAAAAAKKKKKIASPAAATVADSSHSKGKLIRARCKRMERRLSSAPGLVEDDEATASTAATAATAATAELPDVAESIKNNPQQWNDYWDGKSRVPPMKGLSPFEHLLAIRLFAEPQRLPDAVLEFCRQELGDDAVQPRTTNLKSVLQVSTCSTPIVLFAEPGSSIDISPLARAHCRRVARVPMGGKDEGSMAMAAIQLASKAGEWVLLEGIHLCGPFLSHLSRAMEDIVEAGEEEERKQDQQQMNTSMQAVSPKSKTDDGTTAFSRRSSSVQQMAAAATFSNELKKDVYRVRGPIHKSFRLWCVARPIEHHFPVSMLQESVCVVIEAVTGLRSNCLQSLTTVRGCFFCVLVLLFLLFCCFVVLLFCCFVVLLF